MPEKRGRRAFGAPRLRRSARRGHNREGLAQRPVLLRRLQAGAFGRQARRSIGWAALAGRLNQLATGDSGARF